MTEELRVCTKCGVGKNRTEFAKRASKPDGLRAHCKSCERAYPSSDPERLRAAQNRFRERHPGAAAAAKKRYRARYPEVLKASQELYREENGASIAAYNTAYRAANPQIYREAAKRYRRANPERVLAMRAVSTALDNGSLTAQPCFCCGKSAEAHHSSYAPDMQLCVTWLCRKHHKQLHKETQRDQPVGTPGHL